MITQENLNKLRTSLSINAKNGLDFTLSASIIWFLIGFVWTLDQSSYNKSIITFMTGGLMLPLALLLSKLLKTKWTDKENPLQPLGLWLNFAQLFYFPFLILTLIKMPDHFVMVYIIITGAHFFPYSWFYNTKLYAIFAGIISAGALILGLSLPYSMIFILPITLGGLLILLSILLYFDSKSKKIEDETIKAVT